MGVYRWSEVYTRFCRRGTTVYKVQDIWRRHNEAIELLAAGASIEVAASEAGLDVMAVESLQKSKIAQDRMEAIRRGQ